MKQSAVLVFSSLFAQLSFACPGAGTVTFNHKGVAVAVINEYEPSLKVASPYSLASVRSRPAASTQARFTAQGVWQTLCYSGKVGQTPCSQLPLHPMTGGFDLRSIRGLRDIQISLLAAPNTYVTLAAVDVNLDEKQPVARGGCGKTVEVQ